MCTFIKSRIQVVRCLPCIVCDNSADAAGFVISLNPINSLMYAVSTSVRDPYSYI